MQIKTIEKIIRNKILEWLDTISDEKLKSSLKEDIIVTGGCITSLLLNEQVNDFDIYISNRDTLEKVTDYYCKISAISYEILKGEHKAEYLSRYNLSESNSLNIDEDYMNSFIISVKSLKENQLKLFLGGIPGIAPIKPGDADTYIPAYISPNAISLSDKIQIVIRFYGNAQEIHKNYDFVHSTNYFTFREGLVLNVPALTSIITKQLKYQGSLYPVTSILRFKKFIKRGWNINSGEIFKIIYQCSLLDLNDPVVLEEQLIGMDVAYFSALVSILQSTREKEGFVMTSEYLFSIIDRVFNSAEDGE